MPKAAQGRIRTQDQLCSVVGDSELHLTGERKREGGPPLSAAFWLYNQYHPFLLLGPQSFHTSKTGTESILHDFKFANVFVLAWQLNVAQQLMDWALCPV